MYIWGYTGEVNSKRIREKYLQAVLRQDIAFFDNVGAGEVTTRIQTDTRKFICLTTPQLVMTLHDRPRSTRNIRESQPFVLVHLRVLHWLHLGLRDVVATISRVIRDATMHRYHRRCHEQVHVEIHAVSISYFIVQPSNTPQGSL